MPGISRSASVDPDATRAGIGVVLGVLVVVAVVTLGFWHATTAAITQTHPVATENRRLPTAP
jgi:hypothetical protein